MSSVSHHIAATLSTHVDHVFGVMGNGNAYFLDALLRSTTAEFVAVRHEAGAVVAADAYYRHSQRVAAATTTYGAGFTNTLTSLAEAAIARSPLILVVGDEPQAGRRPWDVNQQGLAESVGVKTFTASPLSAAEATKLAIDHALTHQAPVVLSIPYDIAAMEAGPVSDLPPGCSPSVEPLPATTRTRIQRVATRLSHSQRPFILAGRGAHLAGAAEELGQIADSLGAVTASTALARGIFPQQDHDLGVTGGFGAPAAMELIHYADTALVVGASLNQFTMRFGELFAPDTHVIQIDTAASPTHPRVDTYLQGDVRAVLRELMESIPAFQRITFWRESVETHTLRSQPKGNAQNSNNRLDPRTAAAAIGDLLPEDSIIVSDGGHFIAWANMYWPISSPGHLMMVGTAFQSIGQGFPSVAGAAAASENSTIVLTTGDGGGLMALADLETAIRTAGGRGLCVVWNDAAYGAEVHLYGNKGLHEEPMQIPQVDFAALASALGAESAVAQSLEDLEPLEKWLERPTDDRGFLLLDLRIDPRVVAPFQEEVIKANSR